MTVEEVKNAIRNVPDFPIPGIQFKDITTALDKPECLKWMRDEMGGERRHPSRWKEILRKRNAYRW